MQHGTHINNTENIRTLSKKVQFSHVESVPSVPTGAAANRNTVEPCVHGEGMIVCFALVIIVAGAGRKEPL